MAAERAAPRFTVYSRTYCHLCEEMIEGLRALQARRRFEVEVVDVDGDPGLEQRYGELVPVLVHDGRELCHYHLDVRAVTAYLARLG